MIVKAGSFFSPAPSFPRALPFWQISFPLARFDGAPALLLSLATKLFSFKAFDFPEEDESEEDELVDEVNILSPEEELTEDDDDESGFGFWEEFFLVVAAVPSSAVPPDCAAVVPLPFRVGGVDATFPDAAVSPRWWSQLFVGLISPPSPPPPPPPPPATTELFFDTVASTPSFDDSAGAPDVDPLADFLEELTETDLVLLP